MIGQFGRPYFIVLGANFKTLFELKSSPFIWTQFSRSVLLRNLVFSTQIYSSRKLWAEKTRSSTYRGELELRQEELFHRVSWTQTTAETKKLHNEINKNLLNPIKFEKTWKKSVHFFRRNLSEFWISITSNPEKTFSLKSYQTILNYIPLKLLIIIPCST